MAKLYVLGAGTPIPIPDRYGSSHLLDLGEERIMFDRGPATTLKLVKAGLFPTQISHLFFTHHHFDHDVDYPCFLLTRWDQGGDQVPDLEVMGPTLTETLTNRLLDEKVDAFAHDWIARVNHPGSQRLHVSRGGTLPRKPLTVRAKDIGPGRIYSGSDWEVTAAGRASPAMAGLARLPC